MQKQLKPRTTKPAKVALVAQAAGGVRAKPRRARKGKVSPATIEEIFRRFEAANPASQGRARARQSLHPAGGGRAFGAGDGRRCQQGDASAVPDRRHAGQDGGVGRGQSARLHQDHRALPQQGQERDRAIRAAHRASTGAGCRTTAKRSRACRASAARRRTWYSTLPSASRPSRSIRTCSGWPTGSGSHPARRRWRWNRVCSRWCRREYLLHAHHWLILHGRYICQARKPRCGVCLIADLCTSKDKIAA